MGITNCLLEGGADPNLRNRVGETPMFHAVTSRSLPVLEKLLSVSDLQTRYPDGESLLYYVIRRLNNPHYHPPVHILLQKVVQLGLLQVKSTLSGHTPLAMAAEYCIPEAMKLLIGAGADVEARDSKGNSILSALSERDIRGRYADVVTPQRQKIMANWGE